MSQQAAPPTPRALGFDAKKLVLSVYNPERDGFVDQWLTSVSTAIRADEIMVGNRWPETALYYVVGSNLQGSAAAWFQSMETIAINADRTYERLAMRLRQQYGTKLTEAGAVSLIMDRKKMPSETYQEFGMALRALAQGAAVQEQFFIEAFSKGLGDFTGSLVRNTNPVTLMDAIHHATQARGNDGKEDGSEKKAEEDDEQEEVSEEESSGMEYQYGVPPVYTAQRGQDRDEELEDLRRQLRQARKESARPKGKRKRSFVDQGNTGVQLKTEDKQDVRRCHACDETGHVVARCPLVLEIRAWKAKRGKME